MMLLTGFEPFTTGRGLVLTHNPTADIVRQIAAANPDVTAAVLPVSFRATREALLSQFDRLNPRIWLGLGYAPHRTTLDVETIAINVEHANRGDNDGEKPHMRPIIEGGPTAHATRMDVDHAIAVLAECGLEATRCFHAGTFLCNQVFYLGCNRCETTDGLEMAAFIHVPPMSNYDALAEGLAGLVSVLGDWGQSLPRARSGSGS
jgi:pyroglutamyl-peptidase